MGRSPFIGEVLRDFLPNGGPAAVTWEAALHVYNLHGRRDNKYKARIKILVHELGIDEYPPAGRGLLRRAERPLGRRRYRRAGADRRLFRAARLRRAWTTTTRPSPRAIADESGLRPLGRRQRVPHKQPGYIAAVVSLKPVGGAPGDATAEQMAALADIAETWTWANCA